QAGMGGGRVGRFFFLKPLDKLRRRLAVRRAGLDMLLYYVDIYTPYTSMKSRYATNNTARLWSDLAPDEQAAFPFDIGGIDWHDYIGNVHIPGLKRNVLNIEVPGLEEGHGVPVRTIPHLLPPSPHPFPDPLPPPIH